MEGSTVIRSASNPLLKRARAVYAGREPELLALDGDRLIDDGVRAGVELEAVLVGEDRADRARAWEAAGLPVRRVAAALLERVSGLRHPPGAIGLARRPRSGRAGAVDWSADAVCAVAAGVADPGNLGALARSAEAAGAAALAVLAGGVSPWNPKVVRGSMGSVLRLRVVTAPGAEPLYADLRAAGFRQVRADTRGGTPFDRFDWSGRLALWLGSETGSHADVGGELERVSIPMAGAVESLNVAIAGSLLLFAAGRWRSHEAAP